MYLSLHIKNNSFSYYPLKSHTKPFELQHVTHLKHHILNFVAGLGWCFLWSEAFRFASVRADPLLLSAPKLLSAYLLCYPIAQ